MANKGLDKWFAKQEMGRHLEAKRKRCLFQNVEGQNKKLAKVNIQNVYQAKAKLCQRVKDDQP